jgi:starch synthase
VLEAWCSGKPVVATKNGGPGEFVMDNVNGLHVYDHSESVAWGIGTMLHNYERAKWMGNNGRETAKQVFNWDTIAEQTEAVYYN